MGGSGRRQAVSDKQKVADSQQEELQRIDEFAEQWRQQYSLVVVDGGPVDSPLAAALMRCSDATFLCVQLGATQRRELADAVESLQSQGVVLGCITTGGSDEESAPQSTT